MNYSEELKPAKILNFQSLEDIQDSIFLRREDDTKYFSIRKPENNTERSVFYIETSDINVVPNVRQVNCLVKNEEKTPHWSFVLETKEKSIGIAVILMSLDKNKVFNCDIRILPLNSLSDIADTEADSKLLTVNLEKSKIVLKTDVSLIQSDGGEVLYSVHEVNVNAISDFGEMCIRDRCIVISLFIYHLFSIVQNQKSQIPNPKSKISFFFNHKK